MRRSVIAILAVVSILAASVPLVSGADESNTARARTLAYWTPERMAAAQPRELVLPTNGKSGWIGKPGGGGGGTVSGASWTKGGDVLRASGRVYFVMDGSGWICSGSVITDSRTGVSLVLTAGHCAYDQVNTAFATNWLFIPDFDEAPSYTCANTVYGCWTADALVVHNAFATAGGFNSTAVTHDYAVAVVGAGGNSGSAQLDTTVGSFQIAFPGLSTGQTAFAFGYPAQGKYNGKDLVYCAGPVFDDVYQASATWGLSCSMTGGASGGPWFASFTESTGSGTVTSVNSYRYRFLKNICGPKFDGATSNVYLASDSATSNTLVN